MDFLTTALLKFREGEGGFWAARRRPHGVDVALFATCSLTAMAAPERLRLAGYEYMVRLVTSCQKHVSLCDRSAGPRYGCLCRHASQCRTASRI